MKAVGIIPARYASSRFPGKPLADIAGKSMIRRVYERCGEAGCFDELIVATDDGRIAEHVEAFGGRVAMTGRDCSNGTERCAEALEQLDGQFDIAVNIQGDEPLVSGEQLEQLVSLLSADNCGIATLAHHLDPDLRDNRNVVKLALDDQGAALGFSRDHQFISSLSDAVYHHVGLYGFLTHLLTTLTRLRPTPNEQLEKLEQLRWMDHGYRIGVGITSHYSLSVDVPGDIAAIVAKLAE